MGCTKIGGLYRTPGAGTIKKSTYGNQNRWNAYTSPPKALPRPDTPYNKSFSSNLSTC